jgi:pre-mRNA-splicing factor ATP-dependent RNA helicase DHX15/PRP43
METSARPSRCRETNGGPAGRCNPWTGKPFSSLYYQLEEKRRALPVFQERERIVEIVKRNRVVVLQGETGSGKTTQVPRLLLEAGFQRIACTQPRRIAAVSVATRVAHEMDVRLGELVGYTIRFEDVSHPKLTRLKYVTDGMLLREAFQDDRLSRYDCIILDEAHERTLSTDVLMGLLKGILKQRPELHMVVMSATLERDHFCTYFDHAPLLNVSGRMHPVDIHFAERPVFDYLFAVEQQVRQIHENEPAGDVLIFLTGEEEIEDMCSRLRHYSRATARKHGAPLQVLPLYSALPMSVQERVFEPPRPPEARKVIVATNVAETSITIDGITYVIDPGFAKVKIYNPSTRVESLLVSPISQDSARQRAGRAGRTRPGICYRLYTEEAFRTELPARSHPEILRSNLCNVVLTLKKLGIHDLIHFDFMDPPAPDTMIRALEMLFYLGAVDEEVELTPLGRQMAEFPLDIQIARMLLESPRHGSSNEAITLAAMLSVPNVFLRPRQQADEADARKQRFVVSDSDHATLVRVFEAFMDHGCDRQWCAENYLNDRALMHAVNIRRQLELMMQRMGLRICSPGRRAPDRWIRLRRCVLEGFFSQTAFWMRRRDYLTIRDEQLVGLHPSSVIRHRPSWVVFHEFVLTTGSYIRTVSQIEPKWLFELPTKYYDLLEYKEGASRRALELAARLTGQRRSAAP